jgi:malonyl-CoA O-methyltransferase
VLEAVQISKLNAGEAYALWASSYSDETAVSLLEDHLVRSLAPRLAGRRLLDVGCGTGRRMVAADAAEATGVEPCAQMSAAGTALRLGRPEIRVIQGEAGDLPVSDAAFDFAWCRLVLGHVPSLDRPYAELARAVVRGGQIIVSDFHPTAHANGHRRTFRSAAGVHEIEHYPHRPADHIAAAEAAGLSLIEWAEDSVGPPIRHLYVQAGKLDSYEEQLGMPLVFALRFERR